MNMKHLRPIAFLLVLVISAAGCRHAQSAEDRLDLATLLIGPEDLPVAAQWTAYGPYVPSYDDSRSQDSVGMDFRSDLYPSRLPTREEVYRYPTTWEAMDDFSYASAEYGIGEFPPAWLPMVMLASQSHVACMTYSNVSFSVCYWVGRYDRVVVELTTWLIPGRMTLADMQRLVGEIDAKAARLILGRSPATASP